MDKKLTRKPSIAADSISLNYTASDTFMNRSGQVEDNISQLMACVDSDEFDLISIGRSLISDPCFVNKS